MKNKINRKELQGKLSRTLSTYVKSVTDSNSKKISKSIKKASRIVAKAVTKEINDSEAPNPKKEKTVAKKRTVKMQTQPKVIKRLSFPLDVHKVKIANPVKFRQKIHEETIGFISKDGHDKVGKEI